MMPTLSTAIEPTFYDPADWKPNLAQAQMISLWLFSGKSIMALEGGWGCGKTTLIPMIMQVSHEQNPGVDGFVLSPSMGQGTRTISKECARILGRGWTYKHTYHGQPAPHWLSPELGGRRTKVWMLSWKRPSTKSFSANSIEGPSVGWGIADECNMYDSDEPYRAMLGRVRDGNPPKILLLGKPRFKCLWRKFAEDRGGIGQQASSRVNFANLGDTKAWLSTMSPREILENVDCNPQPPEGGIYDMWMPEVWPKGNIAPKSWKPESWMTHHVAMDFGVRNPAALVIAYDPSIDAHVVWSEFSGDGCSVFDMCQGIRRGFPRWGIPGAWPAYRQDAPEGSMPLADAFGDRAGRNKRDDGLMTSSMDDVLAAPAAGGLGMRVRFTDDKQRIDVNAGIRLLWSLIENNAGERRLLCSHDLWHMGLQTGGRSFARSINEYRWRRGTVDLPDKTNGADHHMDALRYWAINARWRGDGLITKAAAPFRGLAPLGRKQKMIGRDR